MSRSFSAGKTPCCISFLTCYCQFAYSLPPPPPLPLPFLPSHGRSALKSRFTSCSIKGDIQLSPQLSSTFNQHNDLPLPLPRTPTPTTFRYSLLYLLSSLTCLQLKPCNTKMATEKASVITLQSNDGVSIEVGKFTAHHPRVVERENSPATQQIARSPSDLCSSRT